MAFVVKVEKAEFLGAAYPVEGERQVLRAGGGETAADLYWGRLWGDREGSSWGGQVS